MSDLQAFLAQNIDKPEDVEYVASKRIKDAKGKPVKWKLCTITAQEDTELRERNTRQVQVPGKRGRFTRETDMEAYIADVAARGVSFPDLKNAELQDSYKVKSEAALLQAMLLPGEYQELAAKVQEINGFDVEMDDLVDEAKN